MAKKEDLKNLNQEELIALIQKCDVEIQRLNRSVNDKEIEIDRLNGLVDKLAKANLLLKEKIESAKEEAPSEIYNEKWEWVKKLVFIVRQYNRPVSSAEILDYLLKHDTVAQYWKNKVKYLSIQLNKATKYKMLISQKTRGTRNHYYLLPEWISNQEK
jgi:hypothetical protein